jgi:cytoskeletal protein CcmA (bactofilin family)
VAQFCFRFEMLAKSRETPPMNMLARHSKIDSPAAAPVKVPPPVAAPVPAPPVAAPAAQAQPAPISTRPHAGPSIISAALTVIGKLESAGDIQIEGKVEGDVRGQVVRIGSAALIKGTVFADVVETAGTIEGKIEARSVALMATARMIGDVVHQSLQIIPGAHFTGSSRPRPRQEKEKIERPLEAALLSEMNPDGLNA